MGTELATISQASSAIATLVNTATTILNQVRMYGTVSAADRQALKDQIAAARSSDVARALASLGVQNLEHTFDLFDLVATRVGLPGYDVAYSAATHTARVLQDNLDNLARKLR